MRLLSLLALILASLPAAAAPAAGKPNLLVIIADDLGYGDLSCYGAPDLKSPALDDLAAQGMRLTNFYANCPVCSPTRAALLSGRYQELVGVPGVIRTYPQDNWGYLSPGATLLPAALKSGGYHSAIVGKWHLGLEAPNRPTDRGFDHFHGFLGDMMDDYYKHRRHGINYMRLGDEEIDPEGHATDLFTEWACDYLKSRQGKAEPWFLYLAYNAPHTPIQPKPEWVAKVKAREPGIADRRAKLVALIEHMDEGIGKVLGCLKAIGAEENTLVLFVSDNGGQVDVGANNGPLRGAKQDMYEGGIRVPMIARWPGKIAAGAESAFEAMTMDLFATALDASGASGASGASAPANLDGRSILPTLTGQPQEAFARDMFWTRREGNLRYMGEVTRAMRRGPWKLVKNSPFAPWELFNLADDPQEENDLAAKERKKFQELAAGMRLQIQRGGAVPWQKPD